MVSKAFIAISPEGLCEAEGLCVCVPGRVSALRTQFSNGGSLKRIKHGGFGPPGDGFAECLPLFLFSDRQQLLLPAGGMSSLA